MDFPTGALDRSLDLRHYGAILWRRKGLLILSSITVFSAALIALSFMPNEYESRVSLEFLQFQSFTRGMEQYTGGDGGSGRSYEVERAGMNSIMARIHSAAFLEKVAVLLRMTEDPGIRQAAAAYRAKHPGQAGEDFAMRLVVKRLQASIRVVAIGPANYEIVVSDYKPDLAQLKAKYVSERFLEETKDAATRKYQSTLEWSSDQLTAAREDLRQAQEDLKSYRSAMIAEGFSSGRVREENRGSAESLHRQLRQAQVDAEKRSTEWSNKLGYVGLKPGDGAALRTDQEVEHLVEALRTALTGAVEDRLAGGGTSGSGPSEADEWTPGETYLDLRTQLNKRLMAVAGNRNPKAEEELVKVLANSSFYDIDAQMQRDAASDLRKDIDSFRQHASRQPAEDLREQQLEREVATVQEKVNLLQEQVQSSRWRENMELSNLGLQQPDILDPAKVPLSPSRPDRLKILLAALLLGPVLGAGFAFLSETTDGTLRTLDDIQRVVPEPILCTTPLLAKLKPRQRGLRRHWVPAAVTGVLVLTAVFFFARLTVLDHIGVGNATLAVPPVPPVPPDSTSQAQRGH